MKRFFVHRLGCVWEKKNCYQDEAGKHHPILVEEADDPSNVEWNNLDLSKNKKECIRAGLSLFNMCCFGAAFYGIYAMMQMTTPLFGMTKKKWTNVVTIVILFVNYGVPFIL